MTGEKTFYDFVNFQTSSIVNWHNAILRRLFLTKSISFRVLGSEPIRFLNILGLTSE